MSGKHSIRAFIEGWPVYRQLAGSDPLGRGAAAKSRRSANLGIRASAYLAAGGFRPLRTAEDHALLAAADQAGRPILPAHDVTVETSARRHARAPHGFSHLLRTLAPAPQRQLPGYARLLLITSTWHCQCLLKA